MMPKIDILRKINRLPIWIVIILFIAGYLNSTVPAIMNERSRIAVQANSIDESLKGMKLDSGKLKINDTKYLKLSNGKLTLTLDDYKYSVQTGNFDNENKIADDIRHNVKTYYLMSNVSIFMRYLVCSAFIGAVLIAACELVLRKRNIIKKSIKPLFASFAVSSIITFIIWRIFKLNIKIVNVFNLLITSGLFSLIMFKFFRHSMEEYYLGEEEI